MCRVTKKRKEKNCHQILEYYFIVTINFNIYTSKQAQWNQPTNKQEDWSFWTKCSDIR